MPGKNKTQWPAIQCDRSHHGGEIFKSIHVSDCPLRVTIEPQSEGKSVIRSEVQPANNKQPIESEFPQYSRYNFDAPQSITGVKLHLQPASTNDKE